MILRFIVFILLAVLLVFFGQLLYKSFQSQKMKGDVGIVDGKLKPCSDKPNCVSSFAPTDDEQHYYPPFENEPIEVLWEKLNSTLQEMKYDIVTIDGQYIHATDTTKIMRYVDDVEFLYSETQNKIFVRSASRVGYSDLGANRKRMDDILKRISEK